MDKLAPFGIWIQAQLNQKDMNMSGLAGLLGVSHATVSEWMHGSTKPRDSNVRKLARVLRVPVIDVYRALGVPTSPDELPTDVRRILELVRLLSPEQRRLFERMIDAALESPEEQVESAEAERGGPTA